MIFTYERSVESRADCAAKECLLHFRSLKAPVITEHKSDEPLVWHSDLGLVCLLGTTVYPSSWAQTLSQLYLNYRQFIESDNLLCPYVIVRDMRHDLFRVYMLFLIAVCR